MWNQVYDPLANELLSTLVAAIPVVVLLVLIASGKVKAHIAAIIALGRRHRASRSGASPCRRAWRCAPRCSAW